MTRLDIFSNEFLRLPLEYKLEIDGSFLSFLHNKLDGFEKRIKEIVFPKEVDFPDVQKRKIIDNIKIVKECVKLYYEGKPFCAYREIDKIFLTRSYRFLKSKKEKTGNSFYRIRVEDSRKNFEPLELFHVPFERRNEITTKRYSIPGFPCLYLSNSIYLAWEENDRPKVEEMHTMILKNRRDISYIDLTFDVYNRNEDFNQLSYDEKSLSEKINQRLELLALWPLIAACSVKVCNKDDVFKPEYIVPQLVLQRVRQDQEVDAIKYSSTKVDLGMHKGIFHNMVFPVKEIKDKDYCEDLKQMFKFSHPISLGLLNFSTFDKPIRGGEKYNVEKLEIVKGDSRDYLFTIFGKLERYYMGVNSEENQAY